MIVEVRAVTDSPLEEFSDVHVWDINPDNGDLQIRNDGGLVVGYFKHGYYSSVRVWPEGNK